MSNEAAKRLRAMRDDPDAGPNARVYVHAVRDASDGCQYLDLTNEIGTVADLLALAHERSAGTAPLDVAIHRICNVLDNDEGAAELYEAALELYRARSPDPAPFPSAKAWKTAMDDPQLRADITAGLADAEAGRTTPWSKVRHRLPPAGGEDR